MMSIFCGPFLLIQLYWARRTRRIANDAGYWSKIYAEKAQEQQRLRANEELRKQQLMAQLQQYQHPPQIQPAPYYYHAYQQPLFNPYQPPAYYHPQAAVQSQQVVAEIHQASQQKEVELAKAQESTKAAQVELSQIQQEAQAEKEKRAAAEKEAENLKKQIELIIQMEEKVEAEKSNRKQMAQNYEIALRYEDAAKIYEDYGMWSEAGRVRMKAIELNAPKSFFKAHNIQIGDSTVIQDSVINRSEIGPK